MALRPPVPRGYEIGRLNTPGHEVYLRECRLCGADLQVMAHVVFCPTCDRLQLMTTPTPSTDGPDTDSKETPA